MALTDDAGAPSSEADLEARVNAALRKVFPSLAAEDLEHQTRFSFVLGRRTVYIDGEAVSRVDARSDVLIRYKGVPLVVLELKRPGYALTPADEEQGLSYAALLRPHPPLVVVTNGDEVRILESYSGDVWKPENRSEEAIKNLLTAASRAARADVKRAVEVLLGPGSEVWATVVRAATAAVVEERSGDWNSPLLPFVPDFLVPRIATDRVTESLRGGRRVVLVEGPPLVGKSSVLRDLAARAADDEFAVLLVDAVGGAGGGIFRSLANLLALELDWQVTPDEVRGWLRDLSRQVGQGRGPALVVAVDGLGPDDGALNAEVEELVSAVYGGGVRLVLALEDTVAERLVQQKQQQTRIGGLAERVKVPPLDDSEFEKAREFLWNLGVAIEHGGEHSDELRLPWVLRALVGGVFRGRERRDENLVAVLPPLLSIELVDLARERFADPDLRVMLRDLARAVLRDSDDATRPASLILASVGTFVVRRETLREYVDRADRETLIGRGIIRLTLGPSDEGLYVARLPELLAAALARLLADGLAERVEADGAESAADWLAGRAASLPLGDIIAARAIFEYGIRNQSLPRDLIGRMVERPPTRQTISPGRYALQVKPGFGVVDVTVLQDGSIIDTATRGMRMRITADEVREDSPRMYADVHPWLILSHLAGIPIAAGGDDDEPVSSEVVSLSDRIDAILLLDVGRCPMVLRPTTGDPERSAVRTHALPDGSEVVCHEEGIVEPITLSLARFLRFGGQQVTSSWIEDAVGMGSFPLLMRVDVALRSLVRSADPDLARWASQVLRDSVGPALTDSHLLH